MLRCRAGLLLRGRCLFRHMHLMVSGAVGLCQRIVHFMARVLDAQSLRARLRVSFRVASGRLRLRSTVRPLPAVYHLEACTASSLFRDSQPQLQAPCTSI